MKLSPDKTEVTLISIAEVSKGVTIDRVHLSLPDSVRSLGVILEPELMIEKQMKIAAKNASCQLYLVYKSASSLIQQIRPR